ncbi:alanine/glycine:cation symporter family protein [Thalassotalea eurytherma]|uniref:Sodium:alanine symporter n=1 Tax=Thalassotalea eurytherma TaxID=1144278 RepID=A0ABQ6H189_9GAMM|nr:alanine/glycine:cation symporter family protein [Thalassotalea eurytherma]GLX80840.1 sodium:alanine symporter [Thalassotalea eurytherma]
MIEQWINTINGYLWNDILIYVLIGCGIWFSVKLKGIQFTRFGHMFSVLRMSTQSSSQGISSFQALCTTLAARVGTGNLMGVAVAISLGGAGAVFWMWLIAFLGMATAFVESALGQLYKEKGENGEFRGGPAYYMRKGLNSKKMAIVFSLCLFFGYGFVFSAVQANSIAQAFEGSFGFTPLYTGIVITIIAAFIILGGLRNIARFAEITVPFMGVAYILVVGTVLVLNIEQVPVIFYSIIAQAFGFEEVAGGVFGAALQGIKRGLYSNEAGMGSSPNAAAAAVPYPPHPVSQGYIQMFAVFFDTIIICSCTAFVILLSQDSTAGAEGIQLTQQALASQVGSWGNEFISLAILVFGFTSIVANFAYADNNLKYINLNNFVGRWFLRVGFLVMLVVGAQATLPQVIALADMSVAMMTLVNVTAIILLTKAVVYITSDYNKQLASGKIPSFEVTTSQENELKLTQGIWLKHDK